MYGGVHKLEVMADKTEDFSEIVYEWIRQGRAGEKSFSQCTQLHFSLSAFFFCYVGLVWRMFGPLTLSRVSGIRITQVSGALKLVSGLS